MAALKNRGIQMFGTALGTWRDKGQVVFGVLVYGVRNTKVYSSVPRWFARSFRLR